MTKTTNDFKRIVTENIPLIDVRAPIEYAKGAFLNSVNLPIMNDEERHKVGICYKEKGNDEAVQLGHQLVSGDIRKSRIQDWTSHIEQYPNSMMYCFRGGQRSRLAQEWIRESGKEIIRLEGGYKAFRNYLMDSLDPSQQLATPVLLGGYTGSGKTQILKQLENTIDLEGIANHRGSSFGQYISEQPSQIDFENNLAYALIKHKHANYRYMILEDEGSHVGKRFMPKPLVNYFNSGQFVLVDIPFEERVEITLNEYVIQSQGHYVKHFGEEHGLNQWANYIKNSLNKIKKRLGGELHQRLIDSFEHAFQTQLQTNNTASHESWIVILLKEYYDPMYLYQMKNSTEKATFTGNTKEVLDYLKTLNIKYNA